MSSASLSAKQCKRARSLLKWNLQDIISRSTLTKKSLEQFEQGHSSLMRPENDELVKIFQAEGIVFRANGDVEYKPKKAAHAASQTSQVFEVDVPSYHSQLISSNEEDAAHAPDTPKRAP